MISTGMDRAAFIAGADVLVTQAAHFAPKTDISHIDTAARRLVVPVVGTPFVWPFSGQGHPESRRRYGKYDPFGGEQGDRHEQQPEKLGPGKRHAAASRCQSGRANTAASRRAQSPGAAVQ